MRRRAVRDRSATMMDDIYAYPETNWQSMDLGGFAVEATDGEIGSVDEASNEVGSGSIVVDTGAWIFGKKVMLPAGVISRIDADDRRVWVDLTKEAIENAPELDESTYREQPYRDELGTYYTEHLRGDTVNRPAGPDYGARDRVISSNERRDDDRRPSGGGRVMPRPWWPLGRRHRRATGRLAPRPSRRIRPTRGGARSVGRRGRSRSSLPRRSRGRSPRATGPD